MTIKWTMPNPVDKDGIPKTIGTENFGVVHINNTLKMYLLSLEKRIAELEKNEKDI